MAQPRKSNLAGGCGRSDRHVRRLMREAGIHDAHLFFSGARVLRAYNDVAEEILPVAEIFERFAFGTRRALHRQWESVTGAPLDRCSRVPLSDPIVESIARRVLQVRGGT